jgi:hypothetical protein
MGAGIEPGSLCIKSRGRPQGPLAWPAPILDKFPPRLRISKKENIIRILPGEVSMGGPIEIGHYKGGFLSGCRPIRTTGAPQQVTTYEAARTYAQNHPGAELIVPRPAGGTYSYDVFTLSVGKKNDRQIAGAPAKALQLVGDIPAVAGSPEVLLSDESNQVRLFMPSGQQNDLGIGRHILDHARGRDIGGSQALIEQLGDAGLRSRLTGMTGDLTKAKADLDAAETTLKQELQTAEQALDAKALPYQQALNTARSELGSTTAAHAGIVRTRGEELREAQRPGIHAAEAAVRKWKDKVDDAESAVRNARHKQEQARDAMAGVQRQEGDLAVDRDRLRSVEFKLRDGANYENQLRAYEAYQKQVAAGQHPTPVAKPNRPGSWSGWDSLSSLRQDRDRLERRIRQAEFDLPRLRDEAVRQQAMADYAMQDAKSQLGYAQGALDGARDHLNGLPVGTPETIRTAQQALDAARAAQTQAVNAAQTKVTDAETELDVNTRDERATVGRLQLALEQAPAAYQAIITRMAKELGL